MRKTALEAHEQLCEQRYSEINRRLDNIERTIDDINTGISNFKDWLIAGSIKVGVGAIIALFSAVYVVKFH